MLAQSMVVIKRRFMESNSSLVTEFFRFKEYHMSNDMSNHLDYVEKT